MDICHRLDGVPLAIELAAARVRLLDTSALAARLSRRLQLLTSGPRDAPARHQTLRAAIDWSYELLSADEQRLFHRLGVFAGGFTLEAAEATCAQDNEVDPALLDLLACLVDQSLAHRVETGAGESRFGMLESIREYALERLVAGDDEVSTRERHARYFLALAEDAEPELTRQQQSFWLAKLEREHDNLRTALAWFESADDMAAAWRLAGALWRFWATHGHFREARERLDRLLARPSNEPNGAARAKALHAAGSLAFLQGDLTAARALYEGSLSVRRALGDQSTVASLLSNLGIIARQQRDDSAAVALHEQSLAIRRALGDRWGISNSLSNLGLVYLEQGNHARARAMFEESLAIKGDLGDSWSTANTVHNLANAVREQGEFARAHSLYADSLAVMLELGDRRAVAFLLEDLACLGAMSGNAARALNLAAAADALRESSGAPLLPADRLSLDRWLASARSTLGESATAAWTAGRTLPFDDAVALALNAEARIT
jgi:non-specific serine/threonine protein kinase